MTLSASRWNVINPSSYPWEREALDFVRDRLPDHDPYLAWANFEFVAQDGSINEIDLLVLSPNGLFLVEIKSRPGQITGDANTWTWESDGKSITDDSPLLLANRKAQRLASLLRKQKAFNQARAPFVAAAVFCSAPALKLKLDERGRQHVYLRDEPMVEGRSGRPGIVALLTDTRPVADAASRPRIDRLVGRAVARAMEQIGIRPTQRSRKVGDFSLERLILEGPGYQDWEAQHVSLKSVKRRVRLYPVATGTSTLSRRTLERAAQREFQILEGVRHPGILQAVAFTQHERGPALVFEHDPTAVRLDLLLRERGDRLSLDTRVALLRQIGEALKHAHERKLYHRALSPQSVLVGDPDGGSPKARIFNWQTGRRDPGSSAPPGTVATRTTHLGELVEDAARVYLAPEALRDPDAEPEPLDVFSLGAITYHLFAGRPPADNVLELGEKLREDRGLQISAVLDGASEALQELIFYSTCGDVSSRLSSVAEFLGHLDKVEDEFTKPESDVLPDPIGATADDVIDGGFKVVKRLGKGSSAVALLVTKDDREYVLKVALSPEHHERLRAEGEVLGKLRHQHVCELHEVLEVGGRLALLMDRAGDQTLAQRLRAEGRLHLDLLERFGEDLLETLDWLEQQGIPHRDIKPENIGVAPVGRGDSLHLVLFDFSLARTPAENIRAGTVPYLDPFLPMRKPPRWDLHAERFAAAMTLHEMATGTLPVWGDGRSDPAMIQDEVGLDAGRFDPDLREPMLRFFERALKRDYRHRFGNTEEMLREWRGVFQAVLARPVVEPGDDRQLQEALAAATLDTPLAQLGLGTRALNALDRANVIDVRGLLQFPFMALASMRGVGHKTRQEIRTVVRRLTERFPDLPAAPAKPAGVPTRAARGAEAAGEAPEALRPSIDLLADMLVRRGRGKATTEGLALEALLGLSEGTSPSPWPSQTDIARALDITRARIGQILTKARGRWAMLAPVEELAAEVADMLALRGGVVTAGELAAALLTMRGSVQAGPARSRLATAVARAVVESEQARDEPRFGMSRSATIVLVAQSDELADYAARLGRAADQLAQDDPLPAPARVLETLQRVRPPKVGEPLSPARLVPLAAAASQNAAVSSRLELYPRGLEPLAALRLAHGALLGVATLTPDQLRERVSGRYPEAQPLPDRPTLDALLASAGLDLTWDDQQRAYRSPMRASVSSLTSSLPRFPTTYARPTEVTPDVAAARQFQAKLQHAFEHGGFLALTVDPRHLRRAEEELRRHFKLERRSLEENLIGAMHEQARQAGADWNVVRRADAAQRDGSDWSNLMLLVRRALPSVERDLLTAGGRVLLVHPGLLARYDQVDLLGRLRDALARPGNLHSLWVLLPADGGSELPVLDGRPIPVITPGQWARIPDPWLQNLHRGHIPAGATAQASPA